MSHATRSYSEAYARRRLHDQRPFLPPYVKCVVPGCLVRTREPTEWDTCPTFLWDDAHTHWWRKTFA